MLAEIRGTVEATDVRQCQWPVHVAHANDNLIGLFYKAELKRALAAYTALPPEREGASPFSP